MADKIAAAVAMVPDSSQFIGDLPQGAGTVFGWLFEAGAAADFNRAVDSFARGAAIVDRLAMNS